MSISALAVKDPTETRDTGKVTAWVGWLLSCSETATPLLDTVVSDSEVERDCDVATTTPATSLSITSMVKSTGVIPT